jgi:NADH dehydrogenase
VTTGALHRPALFRNNAVSRLTEVFMRARIYQPARTAMQSGTARTKGWTLDFMAESERGIDPLMGWTSSGDMQSQVRLTFDSREAAEDYARERGIDYVVTDPKPRKPNIRPRGYGENFASDRKGVWTH